MNDARRKGEKTGPWSCNSERQRLGEGREVMSGRDACTREKTCGRIWTNTNETKQSESFVQRKDRRVAVGDGRECGGTCRQQKG